MQKTIKLGFIGAALLFAYTAPSLASQTPFSTQCIQGSAHSTRSFIVTASKTACIDVPAHRAEIHCHVKIPGVASTTSYLLQIQQNFSGADILPAIEFKQRTSVSESDFHFPGTSSPDTQRIQFQYLSHSAAAVSQKLILQCDYL